MKPSEIGPADDPPTDELVCADQGVPGPPDSCQRPPTMQYLVMNMAPVYVCSKHVPPGVEAISIKDTDT